jgi:hypothetical protein
VNLALALRLAFLLDLRLPFAVTGPVDFVHGFHSRIRTDIAARRSGVHPFAMI